MVESAGKNSRRNGHEKSVSTKNAPSAFLEYPADGDGGGGGGGVAKHTSFTPLRLSAESSSHPLLLFGAAWRPHLLYPLCEGGGGVEDTLNVI